MILIGVLYNSNVLCIISGIYSLLTAQLSVLMVAQLSISRLILMIRPHTKLNRLMALLLPLLYLMSMLTLIMYGFIFEDNISFIYVPDRVMCVLDYSEPTGKDNEYWREYITYTALPIILFFVISCSFITTIIYLKLVIIRRTNGRPDRLTRMCWTVVMVTCLYVACNIPHVGLIIHELYMHTTHVRHVDRYLSVVLFTGLILVNSSVNPVIYYFRMTTFQKMVKLSVTTCATKFDHLTSDSVDAYNTGGNGRSARKDSEKKI
eukprot:sb/3468388/